MNELLFQLVKLGDYGALCIVVIFGLKYGLIPILRAKVEKGDRENEPARESRLAELFRRVLREELDLSTINQHKMLDNLEKIIRMLISGRHKGGSDEI